MKIYLMLIIFISIFSCKKTENKEELEQISNGVDFPESEELYEVKHHKLKYELYKKIRDVKGDKSIKSLIESLVLNHSDSLLKQIKESVGKFFEEEFGLSDEIIVQGSYIQKVPSNARESVSLPLHYPIDKQITYYLEPNLKDTKILDPLVMLNTKLNSKGKFEIDKMEHFEGKFSRFINDNDIYPIMYNLYLSNNQPAIYIVGNRIYKHQNQDKAIFYKRVLKLILDKFHSNWILSPKGTENWEISHEHVNPQMSIENIYEAKSYYVENKIYEEMERIYNDDSYSKKIVNDFLDENIDLFVSKVDEYLKEFAEDEGGIKELKIIAKHEQSIPYEKFVNKDFISIYSAIYNIFLSKFNPKICIVGKKSYPQQNQDSNVTYNNALVLNVMKFKSKQEFGNDGIQFEIKKYKLEQMLEEKAPLKTDIIKNCNFCKLKATSRDEFDTREYIFRREVYNQIQNAKNNQDLINSLVLKQSDSLFRQIKNIEKKIFNDDMEMDRKMHFSGVYHQKIFIDELKEKLKNTKILQNPRINLAMEEAIVPEQHNDIYPLIYNMYLAEKNPVITLYSKNFSHFDMSSPGIVCELFVDKSKDKWKVRIKKVSRKGKVKK
ncbi:hypothetical protein DB313_05215 (plasmid) [Borrelia turcica IST7]|uniref:Lipoprotein n=1 Tax=Borrelia turcica IST7 TaxID=1104446 RepID=A0A386PPK4_9SPIR|nr:hypothetical protein [Borrelia turcica]AYE36899.1 hypothetical protein DB313_05215 [Borrelia turcica IST7]